MSRIIECRMEACKSDAQKHGTFRQQQRTSGFSRNLLAADGESSTWATVAEFQCYVQGQKSTIRYIRGQGWPARRSFYQRVVYEFPIIPILCTGPELA